jgi:multidrug resistance efflux pump
MHARWMRPKPRSRWLRPTVAQYALDRTRLTAPVGGYVNNLRLRPGDYASVGNAIIGVVDESRWRVIANFKEDVAASVKPGTPVWVWLDSEPVATARRPSAGFTHEENTRVRAHEQPLRRHRQMSGI